MKRYVFTLDAFGQAANDAEAELLAKKMAAFLRQFEDQDNRAGVVSIHEVPFGKVGQSREVKQN